MAFPTATVTQGSGLTVNTLPNAGQATMANSLGVAIASDQSAVPVTNASLPLPAGAATAAGVAAVNTTLGTPAQDGTDATGVTPPAGAVGVRGWLSSIWNKLNTSIVVQPGNTANTTAWKVDGSAVTQPISAASIPLPPGAATNAGSANIATAQVSVTTGNITIAAARAGRFAVTIRNITGTGPISVGVTGVSAANGFVIMGVAGDSVTIQTAAAIFGTVASVTQNVCVLEAY